MLITTAVGLLTVTTLVLAKSITDATEADYQLTSVQGRIGNLQKTELVVLHLLTRLSLQPLQHSHSPFTTWSSIRQPYTPTAVHGSGGLVLPFSITPAGLRIKFSLLPPIGVVSTFLAISLTRSHLSPQYNYYPSVPLG